MGSPGFSGTALTLTLLTVLLYLWNVCPQELRHQDALCTEKSCLVLYWQRKVFLDAWRSCKSQGGNLVTIRSPEDASTVERLLSGMDLREDQRVRVWIGLQRLPRKCSATRPLRGFTWVSGEEETQYSDWEQEDSPNTCLSPRCVGISYSTAAQAWPNNLKWKDGPCSVTADGYLCRYAFSGMCDVIKSEGGGNALYTTPFHLVTAFLTHIPVGSEATVPCLASDDQSIQCMERDDGTVGWTADPPFCSDGPETSLCGQSNGGCLHRCIDNGDHYYCDCNEGFHIAEDGMTCVQIDPCHDSPCEVECLVVMDSYRCACPEGFMLAPDEQMCVDVDECLQSPCEQACLNSRGSFECLCREGYQSDLEGNCKDIDECENSPCEQRCENVPGSHICSCDHGYETLLEDPSRCQDVDECQIQGRCEQMCINSVGGFECYCKEGYELHSNRYSCISTGEHQETPDTWTTPFPDRTEMETLDWLTELPNVETVPTDLMWLTNSPLQDAETTLQTESPPWNINVDYEDLEPEIISTTSSLPPTTSTLIPDYYEDESTTAYSAPPTTTKGGGAWKWLVSSSTPRQYGDWSDGETGYEYEPEWLTATTQEPEKAPKGEVEQTQGSSLLLVGLLVPLCILIVVMVVLGIIYCIRCNPKPQNKNATDCYHWIAGAGDKAAADMSGGGITKV
ncbi:CD248 molecule, endosialin a [Hoplias malabaricus]|uniref:CD248 molecule, endosialin a n=1 Tax=Hoplias malabaricus TaxID=27720 RepID=UPI0034630E74